MKVSVQVICNARTKRHALADAALTRAPCAELAVKTHCVGLSCTSRDVLVRNATSENRSPNADRIQNAKKPSRDLRLRAYFATTTKIVPVTRPAARLGVAPTLASRTASPAIRIKSAKSEITNLYACAKDSSSITSEN